jgi:hypothetical protein
MARDGRDKQLPRYDANASSSAYAFHGIPVSLSIRVQFWKSWATTWSAESKWTILADASTDIESNVRHGKITVQWGKEDAPKSSK